MSKLENRFIAFLFLVRWWSRNYYNDYNASFRSNILKNQECIEPGVNSDGGVGVHGGAIMAIKRSSLIEKIMINKNPTSNASNDLNFKILS